MGMFLLYVSRLHFPALYMCVYYCTLYHTKEKKKIPIFDCFGFPGILDCPYAISRSKHIRNEHNSHDMLSIGDITWVPYTVRSDIQNANQVVIILCTYPHRCLIGQKNSHLQQGRSMVGLGPRLRCMYMSQCPITEGK